MTDIEILPNIETVEDIELRQIAIRNVINKSLARARDKNKTKDLWNHLGLEDVS